MNKLESLRNESNLEDKMIKLKLVYIPIRYTFLFGNSII